MDFPGGSVGKEFTCTVGDLGSIPGRPGIFPQVGKIPLEKETDTHYNVLAWRIPW